MAREKRTMKVKCEDKKSRILLRVTNGEGIVRWKFTKIAADWFELEYELDKVQPFSWEVDSEERKTKTLYVVDPYLQKVFRAKKCYVCAYINAKERKPVVMLSYGDFKEFSEKGKYYVTKFVANDSNEMRYSVLYPAKRELYNLKVIEL